MKKITPFILTLSIIFFSCSSNDTETLNTPQEKSLQSYTLKRDASGSYSIDFNTNTSTEVSSVINSDKTNDIILSEVNYKTIAKHSNNFSIENNLLKINFLEANNGKREQINIEDENIIFAKGITEFLNSYSITKNEDDTYQLDFKVNDNVATEFIYNEDLKTYEIHLSNGKANKTSFSRNLTITDNDVLNIDFINYKYASKSSEALIEPEKKPRISISRPRLY